MIVVREEIEEIVMAIQSTGTVDSWIDNLDGTYTVGVNDIQSLEVGFKVLLIYVDTTLNRDIVIDSISGNTFVFTDTNVTQPATWEMALYFEAGHRMELSKLYADKAKSSNKRVQEYPLFWLYTDFEEKAGDGEYTILVTSIQAAIVDFSYKNLTSEDRITNKFIPVLYPIKELIEIAFNTNPYKQKFVTTFGEDSTIKLKNKIDRTFFGSADQSLNVLPQVTDAIEIELDLKWSDQCEFC